MTKVISFLAGPGCGKSTTSAGLFYEMKMAGINAEWVPEYAKKWAWQKKAITPLDQAFLFGKQSQSESCLYGKVDYIVADSSLYLAPMYEEFYAGKSLVLQSVKDFYKYAHDNYEVEHHNILLTRYKPYNPKGRYETEKTANEIDAFLRDKLKQWEVPFTELACDDRARVSTIMSSLGLGAPDAVLEPTIVVPSGVDLSLINSNPTNNDVWSLDDWEDFGSQEMDQATMDAILDQLDKEELEHFESEIARAKARREFENI